MSNRMRLNYCVIHHSDACRRAEDEYSINTYSEAVFWGLESQHETELNG